MVTAFASGARDRGHEVVCINVAHLLNENLADSKPRSVRRDLQQAQEKVREHVQERREQPAHKKKGNDWER